MEPNALERVSTEILYESVGIMDSYDNEEFLESELYREVLKRFNFSRKLNFYYNALKTNADTVEYYNSLFTNKTLNDFVQLLFDEYSFDTDFMNTVIAEINTIVEYRKETLNDE